jgi:hypothetical protein
MEGALRLPSPSLLNFAKSRYAITLEIMRVPLFWD